MKKKKDIEEKIEPKYIVKHGVSPVKMNAMILPVGFPLNYSLAYDSKEGDLIEMYDGKIVSLVKKIVFPAKCDYVDVLCKLIYGYDANIVVSIFRKIGEEDNEYFNELVLIVYKNQRPTPEGEGL